MDQIANSDGLVYFSLKKPIGCVEIDSIWRFRHHSTSHPVCAVPSTNLRTESTEPMLQETLSNPVKVAAAMLAQEAGVIAAQ
jgi:hypothetical protein